MFQSRLIFVDTCVKVNNDVHVEMSEENLLVWIAETVGGRYTFVQDGAPAHTSNLKQWFWAQNEIASLKCRHQSHFAICSVLKSDVYV